MTYCSQSRFNKQKVDQQGDYFFFSSEWVLGVSKKRLASLSTLVLETTGDWNAHRRLSFYISQQRGFQPC